MEKIKIDTAIFLMFIIVAVLFLLTVIEPYKVISIVEWKTIFTLFYILVIVNLLKDSKFLEWISLSLLNCTKRIYIMLIILTLIMSSIITNDIALFVIIPITGIVSKYIQMSSRDLEKLFIFEGISANIGSTLTPIGNPQNLFIFYHYHLTIFEFIKNMIPYELCGILVLLPFLNFNTCSLFTTKKPFYFKNMEFKNEWMAYILIFILVVLSALNIVNYIYLFPIMVIILILKRIKIDYLFLLTFCALFIDIEGIKHLGIMNLFFIQWNSIALMIYSSILSQILSNVPATILLSNLYSNWIPIAYGVNVGGNGTLIASFANLITLRLSSGKIGVIRFLIFGGTIYLLHLTALIIYMTVANTALL
ncbi:SLC13 family permease [Methanothermococcus sp.]|uniref:SLC13 family permease n=1 Tax=Methanothermococcus sp. TaxID=2614238 RepID=UPI0025E438EC|nr:SLC13 family permease [Methanothermococcus sp.]